MVCELVLWGLERGWASFLFGLGEGSVDGEGKGESVGYGAFTFEVG